MRKEINMSRLGRAGFALAVCVPVVCAAVWARAQQTAAPPTAGMSADAGRRIGLKVVVTDKAGNPVAGLTQQDFALLDSKQSAAIVAFHAYSGAAQASDSPTQAIVVLDTANMDYTTVARSQVGIDRFLREN
jgi:hypothetical protein